MRVIYIKKEGNGKNFNTLCLWQRKDGRVRYTWDYVKPSETDDWFDFKKHYAKYKGLIPVSFSFYSKQL